MGPRSAATTPASPGRAQRVGGTFADDDSIVPSGPETGNDENSYVGITNQDIARNREVLVLQLLWRAGALATPALTSWLFPFSSPDNEPDRKQTTRLLRRMEAKKLIIGTPAPPLKSTPTSGQMSLWRMTAGGAKFLAEKTPDSGADFFGATPHGRRATDFDLPTNWLHHCVMAQYLAKRYAAGGCLVVFDAEIRRRLGGSINKKSPDGLILDRLVDKVGWEAAELENARKTGDNFHNQIAFAANVINHGEAEVCRLPVNRISVLRIANDVAPKAARFETEIARRIAVPATISFVDLEVNRGAKIVRSTPNAKLIHPVMDHLRLIRLDHPDRFRKVREMSAQNIGALGNGIPETYSRIGSYSQGPLSGEIRAAFDHDGRSYFEISLRIHLSTFFEAERIGPLSGLKELEPYLERAMLWGTAFGRANVREAYKRSFDCGGALRFLPELKKWKLKNGLI